MTDLTVTELTNVSVSVNWSVNAPGNIEYQPSIIVKAALGNHNAWLNKTWTDNTVSNFFLLLFLILRLLLQLPVI